MIRLRFITLACLGVASLTAEENAWKQASLLFHEESIAQMEASDIADSAEGQLAIAIQLLNLQPKTGGNIREAAERLERLMESQSGTLREQASYYRARIEHLHRQEPDLAQALQRYHELFASAPDSFWGQLAFVKAATLRLYQGSDSDVHQAFAQISGELSRITIPEVRRNLLFTLGEHQQLTDGNLEQALAYYEEALTIGFDRVQSTESLLLRIGKIGEALGRKEVSLRAWKRFLREFPRHSHTYLIAEKVAKLEGRTHE